MGRVVFSSRGDMMAADMRKLWRDMLARSHAPTDWYVGACDKDEPEPGESLEEKTTGMPGRADVPRAHLRNGDVLPRNRALRTAG